MTTTDLVITIFSTTGIVGLLLLGLGLLARSLYGQVLHRDLETHKSNLEKITFEHNVRYESLHIKRAEVIAKLYETLHYAEIASSRMVDYARGPNESTYQDDYKMAYDTSKALLSFFNVNRIYFDKSLCDKIEVFINALIRGLSEFQVVLSGMDTQGNTDEYVKTWQKTWNRVKTDLPQIREELEDQFRYLLGLEPPES